MVSVRTAFFLASLLASLLALNRAVGAPESVSAGEMDAYEKGFTAVQQTSRTFRADLRQTFYLEGIAQPITSIGILSYSSPDRLLIRFSQPQGEWMLVNGSDVVIQKQGKPLQRRDLTSQGKFPSHAANLLDFFHSDATHWHRDFDVSMTREGDHLFVQLKPWMTPTSSSQGVDRILTTLQLPHYDLLGMEITINQGNRIQYAFSHDERNVVLDESLFKIPQ